MRNRQGLRGEKRLAVLGLALLAGCANLFQSSTNPPDLPVLPKQHQIRAGQCVFLTDAALQKDHPLFKELEGLQQQVCKELNLPEGNKLVQVYIFKDRANYERYMKAHFKLPDRRAFFMARTDERLGDELIIYTFWGDRIQEDLRHELTHATLHSVLKNVPMWLDEGLAEYFEVPSNWDGLNYRHLSALRSQPGIPWNPNLAHLERLTLVKDMNPADYRESWAWVHFMLRSTPENKKVLLDYLQQLRYTREPDLLGPRLVMVLPTPETALRAHVSRLEMSTRLLVPAAE